MSVGMAIAFRDADTPSAYSFSLFVTTAELQPLRWKHLASRAAGDFARTSPALFVRHRSLVGVFSLAPDDWECQATEEEFDLRCVN